MINPILGIDTWEGQLEIDESVLRSNDVRFMFIRLNDMNGGHHMDTGFIKQWGEASGFYRAPYFVYNPWVTGQENFDFLAAHMPADARAVAFDLEVKKEGYSAAVYANEVDKFCMLARNKWNCCIYTGEWFLPTLSYWVDYLPYWWAQYPNEFYQAQSITWDRLREKLIPYDKPFNVSKVPGALIAWQFSGDKLTLPGNPRVMDVNVFYGDPASFFGPIAAGGDVVTEPYNGIKQIRGERYGCKVYINDITPANIEKIEVINTYDLPSNICKTHGANIAWNGANWDRVTGKPETNDYSLMIYADNSIRIGDRSGFAGWSRYSSIVRPLLINGTIQVPQVSTDPTYYEKHARSGTFETSDRRLIHITVDGDYIYAGVTLWQLASIAREFGAVNGGDQGGGGDSIEVLDGEVQNIPDDQIGDVHYERIVPQTILIYGNGEINMPTITTYYLQAVKSPTQQYKNPDGTVDIGPNLPAGTEFTSNETNGVTYTHGDRYVRVNQVKLLKTETTDPPVDPPVDPPGDIHFEATFHSDGTITGSWTYI